MSFTADRETAWCLQHPREHNNWPLFSLIVYSQQSLLKQKSHHVFKLLFKSLEGLMLKLQYFPLMLGKMVGKRRRGWQDEMNGIIDSMEFTWANSGRWWRTGKRGMLQSIGSQRVGHDWATNTFHLLKVWKSQHLMPHPQGSHWWGKCISWPCSFS